MLCINLSLLQTFHYNSLNQWEITLECKGGSGFVGVQPVHCTEAHAQNSPILIQCFAIAPL